MTSVSITLDSLGYRLPDGTPLLESLSFTFPQARTGLVGRNGAGKTVLLDLIEGIRQPAAGHVRVSGTLGRLAQHPGTEGTLARLFGADATLDMIDRAEAGTADPEALAELDWTLPARLDQALGAAGLPADPRRPLSALSGGERTRAALAALIFDEPDILLLDEPTNTLDAEGRARVAAMLADWRGMAVVVSHDRALLDGMEAIVELDSHGLTLHGGNYTSYRAARDHALANAEATRDRAEHDLSSTRQRQQALRERQAHKDSAGRASRLKGDAPKMLLDARAERAEGTRAGQAKLADRAEAAAQQALTLARERIEVLEPITLSVPPTGLPNTRRVLRAEGLSGGVIRGQDIEITGPERVALSGPNGAGKTTLIRLLTGLQTPGAGSSWIDPRHVLLDQDLTLLRPGETIREAFLRLNPAAAETDCRAALARFRFRAEAALQPIHSLSGGERMRAGLACVLGLAPPLLLILDEPTNHLDLAATEAVEAGLRAYDGALLVVSHDRRFLEAIGITREIALEKG